MQNSQYVIETISLTKVFPDWWGRAKVIAVEDLNLQVRPNEIYGFLGPNGSGKTTTIKMLLNLLHPTKGAAFVLGGTVGDPKISARIGYLPEESYLYKYLTARETLHFYGRIFGLPASVRKARVETLLEMVGLSGMGNRQIGTFSKGMARRIGLAQALINDPDLLILDEPTSGMDPLGTRQMKDLFVELAQRGKTVLLCSHLLADVEDICDRIGILYGGRMQVEGTVRQLLQHRDETQIRTKKLSEPALERIRQIAAAEGKSLEVENPMDKLESFFVRIIAKARQENQRTSGAEVGTGIQGFLADKPVTRSGVLDQLVSVKLPDGSDVEQAAPVMETPQAVSAAHESPDQNVLSRLVEKPQEVTTESVSTPAPAQMQEAPPVKKSILDELVNRPDGGQTQITRPQKPEEPDHA
ncbi:MAG: ABC transporter ATP-binding protein [Planctomycetaceae bacterium]|nr:ABC transporter ATP-binding protein [Planctomycetaceae bacterium]